MRFSVSAGILADISDRISDKGGVAYIKKRGEKWFCEVCVDRKRKGRTFATKREALAWANEQEQAGVLEGHTLREAVDKYRPIATERKGCQAELSRLKVIEAAPFIDTPLEYITPAMLASWRDKRLATMAPVSVRRELIVLSGILTLAVKEWGWLRVNPIAAVRKPSAGPARRRGIRQAEIDAILAEMDRPGPGRQVSAMLRLSLETGMRLSELCGLRWADVAEKTVRLTDTKNGDTRLVPLSAAARAVLEARRKLDPDHVFTLSPAAASKYFQRSRDAAGCQEVHFHDARSEAITRLSKKLDVLQLARMIGHRDIKSLMIYYAESAEEIADRL